MKLSGLLAAFAAGLGVAACMTTGQESRPAVPPPPDQAAFVAAVAAGQRPQSERGSLQGIEKLIAARDKAVCAAKPDPAFEGWVGQVARKDDLSKDEQYRLTIGIAPDIFVATILPRDHDIHTGGPNPPERRRIEQALYRALAPVEAGRTVRFAGTLFHSRSTASRGCPVPSDLLIRHRLDMPSYSFTLDALDVL